ncbi:hypothetical protein Ctaglu_43900 [Clostridium tagluense]|uniref:Uncharacterized protein n=2 Tax=Clostridium tagluense TaxID=360422 RepID=A0A401UTA1_9CLOT|nr:hypothetical protein Ctaglu_43900 [Clostridium tagluense]
MFSRATIMDIMYLLRDMNTHATLDTYVFRYGLDEIATGSSKDQRVLAVGRYLINNPQRHGILSDNLMYEIVEDIINKAISNDYYFHSNTSEFINYPQLRRLLLKDGFVIDDGKLLRTFDTDIDFNNNETLLENLLNKHNFDIAKGHYNQASNAFNRGDWAACNSQLRSYVEELLNKLAKKITGNTPASSQEAKITLSKCEPPIFYKQLNEWLDNGQGFFETFWKRLHPEGSHPGLSDEHDSIFRLNLVQIATLEVLRRYDQNYSRY